MVTESKRKKEVNKSLLQYLKTGEKWRCLVNDYFEGEEWRGVIKWENKYQVSNFGRIRAIMRYNSKGKEVILQEPYIFKQYIGTTGYLTASLRDRGRENKTRVHRLVAQSFNNNENPSKLICVNHLDFNKTNNIPSNLEWSTKKEDVLHAFDNGRIGRGEKSYEATISNKIALEIFNCYLTNKEITKKYNVSDGLVTAIKTGRTWSSVTGKYYNKNDKKDTSRRCKTILNLETGIFYTGVKEAAESVNMNAGTLSCKLSGKNKNNTSFIYV